MFSSSATESQDLALKLHTRFADTIVNLGKNFQGENREGVNSALLLLQLSTMSDADYKMRTILELLESVLLKNRQNWSDSLSLILCLLVLASRYYAERAIRGSHVHKHLCVQLMNKREIALKAIFALIKTSDRKTYLHWIKDTAGTMTVTGKI